MSDRSSIRRFPSEATSAAPRVRTDTQVEASLAQWFGVFFTQGPTAIKVGNVRVGGLFPPVTTKDSATAGITLSGTIA